MPEVWHVKLSFTTTIHEVALLLNVSDVTVWRMCGRGGLPCIRVGRGFRVRDDWQQWLIEKSKELQAEEREIYRKERFTIAMRRAATKVQQAQEAPRRPA